MINVERIKSVWPVIVAAVCFLAVATTYSCNSKAAELTPVQKASVVWAAANAVTAFAVGWFVLPAVTIAGKQKELCDVMKGTYDPTKPDICEGGDWVRIIPYLPKEK
jgi:hypothetical protein